MAGTCGGKAASAAVSERAALRVGHEVGVRGGLRGARAREREAERAKRGLRKDKRFSYYAALSSLCEDRGSGQTRAIHAVGKLRLRAFFNGACPASPDSLKSDERAQEQKFPARLGRGAAIAVGVAGGA